MKFERSITILAEPAEVFSAYTKVADWPIWDPEMDSASIDGEFIMGARGKIKPKGAPESKIELVEVTKDKSFTVECGLPLCKIHFEHILEKNGESTDLQNIVVFTGFLAPLFGRLIGKNIDKTLPDSLQGLKQYIEATR